MRQNTGKQNLIKTDRGVRERGRERGKEVSDFAAGVFFGSLSQPPSGNIAGLLDDLRLGGRMDRNNCVLFIYRVA